MAPKNLSIDVFFAPPTSSNSSTQVANMTSSPYEGDGFTAQEIDVVLHPKIDVTWKPGREYEEKDIGSLDAGPHCVCVQGRVANLYDQASNVKKPKAAKGCIKMIVKDDTGALTVSFALALLL
jgi:hypothetical protein